MSKLLLLLVAAILGLVALAALFLRMNAAARRPMLRLEREYEFMARAAREQAARDGGPGGEGDGDPAEDEDALREPLRPPALPDLSGTRPAGTGAQPNPAQPRQTRR